MKKTGSFLPLENLEFSNSFSKAEDFKLKGDLK
jgi:hypothetical protein